MEVPAAGPGPPRRARAFSEAPTVATGLPGPRARSPHYCWALGAMRAATPQPCGLLLLPTSRHIPRVRSQHSALFKINNHLELKFKQNHKPLKPLIFSLVIC